MSYNEIYLKNASRAGLICMTVFIIPVLVLGIWGCWPPRYEFQFPLFIMFFIASAASLPLALWALFTLLPDRPVLATTPEGVTLGLWVRRGIPWESVADVRLSEIRLDGGLKKRWSAGRPYRQSLIIDLKPDSALFFENGAHKLVHQLSFSRKEIHLPLKLVVIESNDVLCAQLRERWEDAKRKAADG